MTALTFTDVTRVFDARRALEEVSVEFPSGSRSAIVGPSGSGKSTLLNIAAGVDHDFTGTVRRQPAATAMGYAFQDPRLLGWRRARENVEFVLTATGWPAAAARDRAAEVLDLVALSSSADAYPATLSGGMRQRLSLARAIAVRPALLLLDEPFSAVDEALADELCARIRAEAVDLGTTVIVVTHRPREAGQLADRAVVLDGGRIRDDITFARSEPGLPEVDAAIERQLRNALAAVRAGRAERVS